MQQHHQMVEKYIEQFERDALLNGSYRKTLGAGERAFLEHVWGPAFGYNFGGLKAEYPLKDFKGGHRFADFVFIRNGMRLLIEIDGFTSHARDISPGDFDDHLTRQNDLVLGGWLMLRFSFNQVVKRPQVCQRQLKQAIGHWWAITHGTPTGRLDDMWEHRRQLIIQMAMRRKGAIRPVEVAAEFGISSRSAGKWLKRFASEGTLTTRQNGRRSTQYALPDHADSLS